MIQKENKQSYYMNIPAKVWDSELNAKAILMYGHITVLANKEGYCYSGNAYFEKVLNISTSSTSRYMNELEKLQLIKRVLIYKKNSKEIAQRRIYITEPAFTDEDTLPSLATPGYPHQRHQGTPTGERDNNTSINNININTNIDEVKSKVFFEIVKRYPKNRIGNRQHGLKKFIKLDTEECKLALKNLNRYLAVAGNYVKNIQNYITEECFSEEWLLTEERNKKNKLNINNDNIINNAKSLTNRNQDFYD